MLKKILSQSFAFNSYIKTTQFKSSTIRPLLFKSFANIEDSSSSFIIKQLEEKEINEATACLSSAFSSREVITNLFKVQNSQINSRIRKDLEKALTGNLCLVCREKKANKLAGVVYYEDLTDAVDFKVWEENIEGHENWSKLVDFYKYLFSIINSHNDAKQRNDVLMMKKLAVMPEYTKLGVASNLIFSGRYIHPRTTKAKKSLMIVSNSKTYEFCKKHGWDLIQEINIKDYKDGALAENADGERIYLMKYEPQNSKSRIEELKSFFDKN